MRLRRVCRGRIDLFNTKNDKRLTITRATAHSIERNATRKSAQCRYRLQFRRVAMRLVFHTSCSLSVYRMHHILKKKFFNIFHRVTMTDIRAKGARTSCLPDWTPAARTTPSRSSSVSARFCARPPTGSRCSRECASPTCSRSTTNSNTKPVCVHCLSLLYPVSKPA